MSRLLLVMVVLFFAVFAVHADPSVITQADRLLTQGKYKKTLEFLLSHIEQATSSEEEAEMWWRCSRACLVIGEMRNGPDLSKQERMRYFERGIHYANNAIEQDSESYNAYFYRASNLGKFSELKSLLEAFNRASDMRDDLQKAVTIEPDYSIAWYVLGILYDQLPGGFISFGNIEYAVSFGRKSIEAMKAELSKGDRNRIYYDYYTELAKHLHKRNWSHTKRKREHERLSAEYRNHSSVFEKNKYFEGSIDLDPVSDRTEAKNMLTWVIEKLEPKKNYSQYQDTYSKAHEALEQLF